MEEFDAYFDLRMGRGISFETEVKSYDADFFDKNDLIVIYVPEGSGSVSHTVEQIYFSGETLVVQVKRRVPEVGTADMAGWFISFGTDKKDGTVSAYME